MPVYYFSLVWVSVCGIISNITSRQVKISDKVYENRSRLLIAIIAILPIIILAGFRTGVADTSAYIMNFEDYPNNLSTSYSMIFDGNRRDPGFLFISILIKQFISTDYTVWLSIIAVISGICVMIPLYKYSCNFGVSIFLFVATCQFIWMFNGIRQFLVASIIFGCTGLILRRRFIIYAIIVCLLSTIHTSALILLPAYFIVTGEPWDKRTILFICLIILTILFTSQFTGLLEDAVENTNYASSMEEFKSTDDGTSIMRIAVESVPIIIAFIYRNRIKNKLTSIIKLSINMSLVASGLYIISKIARSGVMLGRLPIYFSMYNLILLPWLIKNIFDKEEKRLVYYLMIVCYIIFFYYQMVISWNGLEYASSILNIKYQTINIQR
ncbi:EpsG family protein [Intestinibacter bartlettii]|uniref:EpsG family protein n=1 Tax=Intestinibacter bartlettii TaxID=261299 RepID=UPI00351FA6AB